MAWDYQDFQDRLKEEVDQYDRDAVGVLVDELIEHLHETEDPYPVDYAGRILQLLRRKRFFAELERSAETLRHFGGIAAEDSHLIRRLHAQALIDQSKLTSAIDMLRVLEADTAGDPDENAEARGLLGRAYKQAYVDAAGGEVTKRSRADLEQSIDWYAGVYDADNKQVWHGINAVALLARAAHDGVELGEVRDRGLYAKSILTEVKNRDAAETARPWDYGTAFEACVALGQYDEALEWLARYVAGADAFGLAGTLRQFEEVWQLDATEEPGRRILPYLRAELLKQEGGRIDFERGLGDLAALGDLVAGDDGTYESVLGTESFENIQWLLTALERATSVARVEDKQTRPQGTAFAVSAEDLGVAPKVDGELLLVTNAHVISAEDEERAALHPDDARINFEVRELDHALPVEEIIDESGMDDLDFALFRTNPPLTEREPIPLARAIPVLNERVYIIGHPKGGQLSFSIYDNHLLDAQAPFLHYRTPTQGGSSGSPVMNKNWDLIGVHHVGNRQVTLPGKPGKHPTNEGVQIREIKDKIADKST